MASSGINVVMTVIGFVLSAMFIVFVCTRLICARILLHSTRRRSVAIASRSDLSILERGLNGLKPLDISSFPTKKFGDAFFTSKEDAQCTVCLADYDSEDTLRILPLCAHYFHVSCIDIWLQQHSTCPVCRISLLLQGTDKKRVSMQPMFSSAVRSQCGVLSMFSSSRPHGSPATEEWHLCESGRVGGGEDDPVVLARGIQQVTKGSENKEVESPSSG
ncbi:RING-H2 finger protein ATL74-like [Ipomoea triloba]|uniref:RING-H2 finger protein ATL74-like n=1 Tax=Ipomoea triloba TaxID=35885 RepID=UPI00125DBC8E|nr:RING-H2 finger protein ATL74-like [Ipomoea triloba]